MTIVEKYIPANPTANNPSVAFGVGNTNGDGCLFAIFPTRVTTSIVLPDPLERIYFSRTEEAGKVPPNGWLAGELAFNLADQLAYVYNSSGIPK
jgi:hypothetical protein